MSLRDRATDKAFEGRRIVKDAEEEDRELSRRERATVERLIDEAHELHEKAKADEAMRAKIAEVDPSGSAPGVTMSDPKAVVPGQAWDQLAEAIAVKRERHIEIPTEALLGEAAPPMRAKDLTSTDLDLSAQAQAPGLSMMGMDARWPYTRLRILPVVNELPVSDFRQTGSREVTGNVLRDLTATSTKAELDVSLDCITVPLKQVAITVQGIPNALLDGVQVCGCSCRPRPASHSGRRSTAT